MRFIGAVTEEEVFDCFWTAERAATWRWSEADLAERQRAWREGDRAIAAAVTTNPELIVVTEPSRSKLVCLEGHIRLSSYANFPEHLPDELELYLGVSPRIAEWANF